MTKDEYDYVMANAEYKRHCEIIENYVKSKFLIDEEKDGTLCLWASNWSQKPEQELREEFLKLHPDGDWDMFEVGCRTFFEVVNEILSEHEEILEDYEDKNIAIRHWIERGTDYVFRAMNPTRYGFRSYETPED